MSELANAKKEAYSIKDNKEGMKYIGSTNESSGRVYQYYKDESGQFWYETHFKVEDKLLCEEEYIFGKKIKQEKRGYKRACY